MEALVISVFFLVWLPMRVYKALFGSTVKRDPLIVATDNGTEVELVPMQDVS